MQRESRWNNRLFHCCNQGNDACTRPCLLICRALAAPFIAQHQSQVLFAVATFWITVHLLYVASSSSIKVKRIGHAIAWYHFSSNEMTARVSPHDPFWYAARALGNGTHQQSIEQRAGPQSRPALTAVWCIPLVPAQPIAIQTRIHVYCTYIYNTLWERAGAGRAVRQCLGVPADAWFGTLKCSFGTWKARPALTTLSGLARTVYHASHDSSC
jgi:hypothetical protein